MTDLASPAPVAILGAGLTGLSCAYHLGRTPNGSSAASPVLLVEREGRVGGHARTHRREGYSFDVTGHWLHLRDDRMKALVGHLFADGDWARVDRETKIWSHGAQLEYPFQANLHGLPLEVVTECLVGFVAAQRAEAAGELHGAAAPKNFTEFVTARFGAGIAKHFFIPYNSKLWGMSPDELTANWVSRFLPVPNAEQLIGGAVGMRQEGLGYNAHFMYPKAGGIDALPKALAGAIDTHARTELLTDRSVEEVDLDARRLKLSGESATRAFSQLVSTLPLPTLIERITKVPSEIREAASALRWVQWRYLDLATRTACPRDWHWCYVPEMKYPFFRVGCYTNAMPSMAPDGGGAYYVELNDRAGELDMPGIVQGLVEMGAVTRAEDIAFTQDRKIEFAYVVFDDAHAEATSKIHAWLATKKVRSCGRYGAWIYNSMEDSMIQGLEAATWASSGA